MDQPTLRTFIIAITAVCIFLLLSFFGIGFVLIQDGFSFSEEVGAAFNAFALSVLTLALTASGIWGRAILKRNTEITEAAANGQREENARLHRENSRLEAQIAYLQELIEMQRKDSRNDS